MFSIRMGIPEMKQFWDSLITKIQTGTATKDEQVFFKKLGKALKNLASDPRYPALRLHEISDLSKRYGMKVWESYLENQTPAAGRIFWVYGPERQDITVIGIEPHPNDKKDGYDRITLSAMEKLNG